MGTEILEAALAYASKGIPVFPLQPRGKVPLVIRGFKDASTDPKLIQQWFTRWPAANLGIPTGEASGWAVVDIDPRHGGDISLERLIAEHGPVPDTLESLTGGGGRHFVFQWVPGFSNSTGALKGGIAAGIDTRGTGGYIVVPPSIHESGRTYEWEGGEGPGDKPLAPIPDWLHPGKIKAVILAPDGTGNLNFTVGENKQKADGQPVAPGGRNMAAASLAGQYIREGATVAEVVAKLRLWNANNPVPLPDKEILNVAASIGIKHAREHPSENVGIFPQWPEEQAIATGESGNGQATAESIIETPAEAAPAPVLFPDNLLAPPGFVGELCQWINRTAYMPQPVLALGNALAFMGAIVGRKVQSPSGLRTNLYCLGVGESGCGKDHSRQQIKRICEAAGITEQALGGEDVSSDAAIWGAVFKRPAVLFQWDEIGHMLAAANSKNAMAHQKAIVPLMMRLFSSARTKILGKEYAGVERVRQDIDQPNVCLYGTTVPGRLYKNITYEEIADGFLGRMLVFKSNDPEPAENDAKQELVPDSITKIVKSWWDWAPPPPPGLGNLTTLGKKYPAEISFATGAVAVLRSFRERCKTYKKETREKGLDPLWSRAVEHATKVAMIIACGEDELFKPVVSEGTAVWAVGLTEHLTAALLAEVGNNVSNSDFERDLLYVSSAIRSSGSGGITSTLLARKTQRMGKRQRGEILDQLLASNSIGKKEIPGKKGPPAITYYIK